MAFDLPPSIFAITDFWMTRWMTPVWFLGMGVILGFAVLSVLLGIFFLLSKVPFLERMRRDGSANVLGLIVTLALGGGFAWFLRNELIGARRFSTDEWIMISLAVTIILAVVVFAFIYCSSARFLGEVRALLFEGVGLYMVSALASVAALGLVSTVLVDNPLQAIQGVPTIFMSGERRFEFDLTGSNDSEDPPFQKIDITYDPSTLNSIYIETDRTIMIGDAPTLGECKFQTTRVEPSIPLSWTRTNNAAKSPFALIAAAEVYIQNQEFDAAKVKVRLNSIPPVPQGTTFVFTAVFIAIFGLLFMLMQAAAPKSAAIALSAAKSELSQPLPVILMMIVALAILLFVFLPFHTFGEDIKLLKDCGITLILVAATFQAVWSASTSVNDEIEGRTALTLLSKPIHRRSFIIGKIMGMFWIVMFMFLVLGSIELLAVAYKPIVDAREASLEQPLWQQCHFEMMQTIPGLALAFFQVVVLGSFAVALGTRFSLITNFTICFSIYLLGHLTPSIVGSAAGGLPLVEFFSQLISAVIPNLSNFSMEAAIDAEVGIPWSVISSVLVYATIYGICATLIGLLLFEDRDLA